MTSKFVLGEKVVIYSPNGNSFHGKTGEIVNSLQGDDRRLYVVQIDPPGAQLFYGTTRNIRSLNDPRPLTSVYKTKKRRLTSCEGEV